MARFHMMLALVSPLAACGPDPVPPKPEKAAIPFPAGEWEVSTTTETLKGADFEGPATAAKVGATTVAKVCAAPGPAPDPALFTQAGDKCTATSAYAKGGRVNISYNCNRPGRGMLTPSVDGKYDATMFEVASSTGTYFAGAGDYVLTQLIRGKRLGDCAPGTAAAG